VVGVCDDDDEEREKEREMDGEMEGGSSAARFSVVWKM
jgi:hypothetical protein